MIYLLKFLVLVFIMLPSADVLAQKPSAVVIKQLGEQGILLDEGWVFHSGDNPEWAKPGYNDTEWQNIDPTADIHYLTALREAEIGWFRLHLDVDSSLLNIPLAFLISQLGASEIYLDGKLIYKLGIVSHDSNKERLLNPRNNPYSFQFKGGQYQVLAIRYSFTKANPYLNFWGRGNPCLIVNIIRMEDAINKLIYAKSYPAFREFGKIGFLMFLGLLHLFFYFSYPKRLTNLYHGLFTLTQGIGFLLTYSHYIPSGASSFFLTLLANVMWLMFGLWGNLAVYSFAKRKPDLYIWLIIIGIFITLFLFRWPYAWGGYFLPVYIVLNFINATRVSLLALRDNLLGSKLIFVGFLVATICFSLFYLVNYGLVNSPPWVDKEYFRDIIFHAAIFFESLPFSILLAWEYARTNRSLQNQIVKVKALSAKNLAQQREKQQILANQNKLLEYQVAERTTEVVAQKEELQHTLEHLKATQTQLFQSEKMASLGELTAGIAHEIQNPLNFINNFSDVNTDLLADMKEEIDKGNINEVKIIADNIEKNEQKIRHHGQRADAIVKGMLQHSRSSSGQKELTDINALADEYLRLSYLGFRAKEKDFNASLVTDFDPYIDKIEVVPQEIGRVLLNLYNNAFYATQQQKKNKSQLNGQYQPKIKVSTRRYDGKVEISIKDNGIGIPESIKQKVFQPFFTTKPTGEGTGLGLSLSYDIIAKWHDGEINLETQEGEGAAFIINLPCSGSKNIKVK